MSLAGPQKLIELIQYIWHTKPLEEKNDKWQCFDIIF